MDTVDDVGIIDFTSFFLLSYLDISSVGFLVVNVSIGLRSSAGPPSS